MIKLFSIYLIVNIDFKNIISFPSSLFNVPGTSSAGTMRPNSVAVSNLSSSGSGADYAAKVAFIGKKYRKT